MTSENFAHWLRGYLQGRHPKMDVIRHELEKLHGAACETSSTLTLRQQPPSPSYKLTSSPIIPV